MTTPVYAIGVDPGSKGAIALVGSNGYAEGTSLDTKDATALRDWVQGCVPIVRSQIIAAIEKVSAGGSTTGTNQRMGSASAFKFGDSFGCPRGVLVTLRIPLTYVTPQKWQKQVMGLGKSKGPDRKELIRKAARERWPDVEMKTKGRGQAVADALFIARWALMEETRPAAGEEG